MWYFAWILGLGLAVAFGVLNGIWHEFNLLDDGDRGLSEPDRGPHQASAAPDMPSRPLTGGVD